MNKGQTQDIIVRFDKVSLSYGQTQVLQEFSLDVKRGRVPDDYRKLWLWKDNAAEND